jgi:hypothetical protein
MLWFAQGVHELQEAISAVTVALEISSRNSRVVALQKRWERPARRPGSARRGHGRRTRRRQRGCWCASTRARKPTRLVTRIDPGAGSRWSPRCAAKTATDELERWKTGAEERKVIDASAAAITLAMLARHRTCWSRRPWFAHGSASSTNPFHRHHRPRNQAAATRRGVPRALGAPACRPRTGPRSTGDMADLPRGVSGCWCATTRARKPIGW